MDPTRLQILVTVAYPALFGAIFLMISIVGCRLHTHHVRLTNLEIRVSPAHQVSIAHPAPEMMDPMPPAHVAIGIPTAAAVSHIQRYTGYI
jgi:hypothetical protein